MSFANGVNYAICLKATDELAIGRICVVEDENKSSLKILGRWLPRGDFNYKPWDTSKDLELLPGGGFVTKSLTAEIPLLKGIQGPFICEDTTYIAPLQD